MLLRSFLVWLEMLRVGKCGSLYKTVIMCSGASQGVSFEPDAPRDQAGGEHGSAPHQDPVQGSSSGRR